MTAPPPAARGGRPAAKPVTSGSVVMVDWLGRGGIAHTAESWLRELDRAQRDVVTVTRSGRELANVPGSISAGGGRRALLSHASVVRATTKAVTERRPSFVVVHGAVLPQVEIAVLREARRVGAVSILVAHEARVTRRSPGAQRALRRLVRTADMVVVHSRFVASRLQANTGRSEFVQLPLPLPLGLVTPDGLPVAVGRSCIERSQQLLALHFGHLHRGYKGTSTLIAIAAPGVPGWRFALVGKGAPVVAPGAISVDRFLDAADLVATVAASDATLLPYQSASQSAAVVLSQALGSVVISTGVGGLPEQVEDASTGLLLAPESSAAAWRDALERLSDRDFRQRLGEAGRAAVVAAHARFAEEIGRLLA